MGKVGRPRKNPSSSSSSEIAHHHFFKVYIPSISSHELKISSTFVERINGVVPRKVILRDPRGRLWNVETKKVEGAYYFEKGWRVFVENNFLKLGEFLVFRYMGNSVFDVMILDNSGCDKEISVDANMYQFSKVKGDGKNMEEKMFNKEEEVCEMKKRKHVKEEEKGKEMKEEKEQEMEEERGREANIVGREQMMHQRQECGKEEDLVREEQDEKEQDENQGLGGEEFVREEQEVEEMDQDLEEKQGQQQEEYKLQLEQDEEEQCGNGTCNSKISAEAISVAEKDMECNAASGSTHTGQPIKASFVAIFQPWRPYYLHIPKQIITSNQIKLKPEMVFRDPSRMLWPVRIFFTKDGRYIITAGWSNFCRGHNLTQHDKCILEFSRYKGRGRCSNIIDVNIVRATTPGESSSART